MFFVKLITFQFVSPWFESLLISLLCAKGKFMLCYSLPSINNLAIGNFPEVVRRIVLLRATICNPYQMISFVEWTIFQSLNVHSAVTLDPTTKEIPISPWKFSLSILLVNVIIKVLDSFNFCCVYRINWINKYSMYLKYFTDLLVLVVNLITTTLVEIASQVHMQTCQHW